MFCVDVSVVFVVAFMLIVGCFCVWAVGLVDAGCLASGLLFVGGFITACFGDLGLRLRLAVGLYILLLLCGCFDLVG